MQVSLGIPPSFSEAQNKHGLPSDSNSPSHISYVLSSDGESPLFEDNRMRSFSYIPVIDIEGKSVIFLVNDSPVIFYDNTIFSSLPKFFEKISISETPNQELLDKIATIANFLALGMEYKVVEGSARKKDKALKFKVHKDDYFCHVTLPSFKELVEIDYEDIIEEDFSTK